MFRPYHWAIFRSRIVSWRRLSPPRYYSRPEDGPVIGPKHVHVVLFNKYYTTFFSCVRLYYTCTFILHLTQRGCYNLRSCPITSAETPPVIFLSLFTRMPALCLDIDRGHFVASYFNSTKCDCTVA